MTCEKADVPSSKNGEGPTESCGGNNDTMIVTALR